MSIENDILNEKRIMYVDKTVELEHGQIQNNMFYMKETNRYDDKRASANYIRFAPGKLEDYFWERVLYHNDKSNEQFKQVYQKDLQYLGRS